jgi:putative phosphoesterase
VLERQIRPVDALIFCGDGLRAVCDLEGGVNVFAVAGNCDVSRKLSHISGFCEDVPYERVINLDGKRILLLHGHTRGVKFSLTAAIYAAREVGADALIFGHTHTAEHFYVDGADGEGKLEVFNPGALQDGSFGTLEIRNGSMMFSHGRL